MLGVLAGIAAARILGRLEFFTPLWLLALLLLPLLAWVAVKGMSGLPSRTNAISLGIRSMLLILLILCLADTQIVRENESLSVLFLMDHSASVPENITEKELQYVNGASATKGRNDTAGIVVLGENASVELMPGKQDLKLDRIYSCVNKGYTDLQGALELATAAFPSDARKKIVLITDGNENKGNLMDGIKFAAGNHVVTDILPVSYDYEKEVMIESIHLPDQIKEKETFDLRVSIRALQNCPADLVIYRNGAVVAREPLALKRGQNSYATAIKIEEPGFYTFTARISSPQDTVKENNEASGYVYIQGGSRTLFVSPTELEVRYVVKACREDGLEADIISPQDFPDSLGQLQNYDCVILANVPADELPESRMGMLQANVRDLGVGLIMIGGENSFGAGGYEQTPIEEALPVSMDIKQKKINPKGALVLILHTCEFPDGNYWAKEISKKAIDTVNSQDEVGVLIYGAKEEWLFPLRPAEDKKFMYGKIDGASPGDMPSFEPTVKMAYEALSKSDAMVRHIIIISDGDPARPPPQMIKDIAAAGITMSTVGINPHSERDVDVLKYMAQETGGRFYFAEDPSVLPRIFVKEAKVVKRSLIFNKKFQPLLVLSSEITKGINENEVPPLMAYVATTGKPRAIVPMVSDNENQDPILAYWRYGLGKSVAFTSDATSNWGKEWVSWAKYKKLWTQTVRWASRKRERSDLRIRTEMDGGRGKLIIDAINPQGTYVNFLKLNGRIVGSDNKGATLAIHQTAPGRYEADFEARQVGVSIINVGYQNPQTGGQGFMATGVSIPYSPEFHKLESNLALLREAAAAGGGRLLSGIPKADNVFTSSLPSSRSFQPIWERLLLLAVLVFFVDVVLRRVIVTREDVRAAWASVRARFTWRKQTAGRDKTMESLLTRKKKTFEKVQPAAPPVEPGFKRALDEAADQRRKGETVEVDRAPEPAPPVVAATPKAPDAAPKPAQAEADQESYTGRLLAAKKRAKKDSDSKPESDSGRE